ncbi:MAG TPA: type II toxin-antitoxin system PemK/MazF family toxin [Thermoanaerobaculia bacterium]|nr:type II toxin-antitoxin system PemK/MazF family toxin [Thermoanaerobaculia bacterium]
MGGHGRVKPGRGIIVVLSLDPTVGHEQKGVRPCVVVSASEVIAEQRYPLVCVVPITGTPGEGALYPPLKPGASGLGKLSFALIDQLRSVDKRRITRFLGRVSVEELKTIDEGLRLYLGLV